MDLSSKAPQDVDIRQAWETHKFRMKLVNPANRRKYNVIVVGSGLAGASAAATLGDNHSLLVNGNICYNFTGVD